MGDRQREEPNKILLTVTPFLTKGKLYIFAFYTMMYRYLFIGH